MRRQAQEAAVGGRTQLRRPKGRVPSTDRGERTRERLLECARTVFQDRGYLAARVTDVAELAGVGHGTFYKYFESKDDVFRELTNRLVADMFDRSRARYEGSDSLVRIALANWRYLRVYREDAPFIAVVWQVAMFDPEYREFWLGLRQRWAAAIRRWVEREIAAGAADADLDPAVSARALGLMMESFAHEWFVLGETYDEEAALRNLTRLWVNALRLAVDDSPERIADVARWVVASSDDLPTPAGAQRSKISIV